MVKFTYVYTPEIPVVQAIVYNCRICPYAHIYEIFYLKDGVLFAYRRDNTGKVNTRIKDIPDKEAIIKELKSYKPEPGPRPEDRNDAI